MKNLTKISSFVFLITFLHFCSSGSSGSPTASNDFIAVSGPTSITGNLATTGTATVTIDTKDFEGDVTLSLDRSALDDEYAANGDIVTSLSTDTVTVGKNETKTVTLSYEIKGSAPAFFSTDNGGKGELVVTATVVSENKSLKINIPFEVSPVCEIRLYVDGTDPAGTHVWKTPDGELANVDFRHYDGDLTIRFINTDTFVHRVHTNETGGGALLHQDDDMTAADTEGADGGSYEAVANQEASVDTKFYCHTTGHGSDPTMTLTFNN